MTAADYVLVESTYGGREHEPEEEAIRILAETVRMVAEADGVLLVPSFAIGRTQEVVWELDRLIERGEIPLLPLYLDSPMASKASDIYRHHPEYYDEETAKLLREGDTPLDYPNQIVTQRREAVAGHRARAAAVHDRGLERDADRRPGRRPPAQPHRRPVGDDPVRRLPGRGDARRAPPGRRRRPSSSTGRSGAVRCQIRSISGFSAHADESELLDWLRRLRGRQAPGDPAIRVASSSSTATRRPRSRSSRRCATSGFATHVPHWHERVTLD